MRRCPLPSRRPLLKSCTSKKHEYHHSRQLHRSTISSRGIDTVALQKSPCILRVPNNNRYIDTSNLQQSLENIRYANRTRIIRKSLGNGKYKRLELDELEHSEGKAQTKNTQPAEVASFHVPVDTIFSQYIGTSQSLTQAWLPKDGSKWSLNCPWLGAMPSAPTIFEDATHGLSREIRAYGAYMAPTKSEAAAADIARTEISKMVSTSDSSLRLEIIGSRASGLAAPLSDLDFNLLVDGNRLDDVVDRNTAKTHLERLKTRLRRDKSLGHVMFIGRAKIPIVRGFHQSTGLEFQIQCTTNAYNSTRQVRACLEENPDLCDLFLVVKQMLTMRGLTNGAHQGLSSYPLFNMLLLSLKLDEQEGQNRNSGQTLLSFLTRYSYLDFDSYGLTIDPPALLAKAPADKPAPTTEDDNAQTSDVAPRNPGFEYAMYLRDPADPSNDLGRNCFLIRHVQATFLQAKRALEEDLSTWRSLNLKKRQDFSLLRFLHADYRTFELDRASLHLSLRGIASPGMPQ